VSDGVVWVGDPESCRSDVIILQRCALPAEDDQVVLHNVPVLNAILYEHRPSFDVIHNIVFDQDMMGMMQSDSPVGQTQERSGRFECTQSRKQLDSRADK